MRFEIVPLGCGAALLLQARHAMGKHIVNIKYLGGMASHCEHFVHAHSTAKKHGIY